MDKSVEYFKQKNDNKEIKNNSITIHEDPLAKDSKDVVVRQHDQNVNRRIYLINYYV